MSIHHFFFKLLFSQIKGKKKLNLYSHVFNYSVTYSYHIIHISLIHYVHISDPFHRDHYNK